MRDTVFPDNIINIIDETLATLKYENKKVANMADINKTISSITNYLVI